MKLIEYLENDEWKQAYLHDTISALTILNGFISTIIVYIIIDRETKLFKEITSNNKIRYVYSIEEEKMQIL